MIFQISNLRGVVLSSTEGPRVADRCKALVVDFSAVPFLDSAAANAMAKVAAKAPRRRTLWNF
jgi:anti-anti-sigma regulatory factor